MADHNIGHRDLELLLQRQIEVCVSTPSGIAEALKRSGSSERALQTVSEDFKFSIVKEQEDGGEEVLSLENIEKDESPIIKLMHTTVFDAIQRRASDIHIEATDKHVMIKYRIDGVLYPATEPIDIKFHSAIVSRIKVMSDLDIAERRVPQDGRFKIRTSSKTIDFRVSIMPSAFGEDIVIRILDKESITAGVNSLRLDSLGFDENDLRRFRKSIREPYGMVLVTGPTGSGKTTTLYAALTEINTGEDKFITIEDPVEYQLRGVVQIPVNEKRGSPSPAASVPSFATIRTRSWSARSATPKRPRSPSSQRSPATSSSRPSTRTTLSTCLAGS
jgi:type IV pilus assembly protein PilB